VSTDERVQAAIANWAPRFIASGVDYSDFQRVTRRVEQWDDWCREWSACGAGHAALGAEAETRWRFESAGEHYFRAAMAYHFGKFLFVHRPEELRAAHHHVVDLYQQALAYLQTPAERIAIPYEGDTTMYGILRKPYHVPRPPVVLLVPGLDSVKEELHSIGDDFLRRGMAVLAIDGPGQGEMEFTQPMRHDYEVPVRYAIDYLQTRRDLDMSRVGLLGVSLGGYYAVRAAAFDPRIRAAISLGGPYSLAEHFADGPVLTRDALIFRLYAEDEGAALEKLRQFDLSGVMGNILCPLLVIMGGQDRIVPPQAAERMANEAKRAQLWMFEEGNHACSNIPYKFRPQQADWMRETLRF
jgi:2,6-dihydroxypseudooxynicotine hydrolase